jgi:tetratricopeptide (TPR) repeat protein
MRYLLFLVCLLYFAQGLFGQATGPDSRWQPASANGTDTNTVEASLSAGERFIFLNTDSSIRYVQTALLLAKKMRSRKAEADADYLLSGNYWIMGQYSKALNAALESLRIYEISGDKKDMSNAYRAMASIYRDQGDYANAIGYAYKCKAIADTIYPTIIYTIIASIYEKFNRLDSALAYINRANESDHAQNANGSYGYIPFVYGNIYAKQSDNTLALAFYRKALVLSGRQEFLKDQIEIYNGIATLFDKIGTTDSSIAYAKKALQAGQSTPFLLGMLESSSLLSKTYKAKKDVDSTVKYMELTAAMKDTLYNQEANREFQSLSFQERLRQQESEEMQILAAKERRDNLQDIGIAAFIPLFFGIFLFLSRRKVNTRVVEFIGILGLLLLFEFITLLIHPYIESFTHDTPVFMVLILMAIASILVPSHHRLEKWLKNKFIARPVK